MNRVLEVGQTVMTRGVQAKMITDESGDFETFVCRSIDKHRSGDWGTVCKEDKQCNDDALKNGERVLSAYEFNSNMQPETTKIWIITEWDRSATTVLFPEEY